MSTLARSAQDGLWFIEQAVTVEAGAYSSGDLVGGLLTLSGAFVGYGGFIQSVVITDLAKQSIGKDVVFFDANPSNTTFTENSALDINDTDLLNVVGVAPVLDWFGFNDNSVGQALNLAMSFRLAGADLYAAIVERGAPTYASISDLSIRVGILPG